MITDPEDPSRPLLEIFQENARVYLTQKNKINKRIFESALSDSNSAKIAESTNSQTPIRSRDLRSNDEVQKKLEESFRNLGYYYERKSNQYREQPRYLRIDALSAGQAYLAYQLRLPEVAGKDRGKIFGELYDEIFNDDITAPRLLVPLQVFQPIEEMKRNLERAVRRGQSYDPAKLFLVDGAYHLLFAVEVLCTLRNIDYWHAGEAFTQLEDATRVIQAAVRKEASDPAFAYKRFFKSTRARRYIEEAARELVTPGETA